MGFTYKDDIIQVDGRGFTISTVTDRQSSSDEWKKGTLKIIDLGTYKNYEVYISKGNADYQLFIKPSKKYECKLFEDIFEFKPKCSNYTNDRIIGIKNKY